MGCSPHARLDASSLGFDYENGPPSSGNAGLRGTGPLSLDDRQLDAAFDDARADGVAGESGGVVDVELLHEMLAMLLDGLDADAEFRRGFLVGLALSDQLQHFHLARSQLGGFLLEQSHAAGRLRIETLATLGNGGAEKRVSFLDFPNRPTHFVGG